MTAEGILREGRIEMRVTAEMKVRGVLEINERMVEAFVWLAPEFRRPRIPSMRRLMAARLNVRQAARVGRTPLKEALYVLNPAAGEDERHTVSEPQLMRPEDFEHRADVSATRIGLRELAYGAMTVVAVADGHYRGL